MKKLLIFLIFLSPLLAKAQAYIYHPFPTNEGCWRYQYYDDFHNPTGIYTGYDLLGDTIIAGSNYKKISGGQSLTGAMSGAIRDSNKVVYFRPDTSSGEFVLYDFNLGLGDTIFNPYGGAICSNDTVLIQSVDSVLLADGYHRSLGLSSMTQWIEGVGSIFYLMNPCNVLCVSGNDNLECMHGDIGPVYTYGSCGGCAPLNIAKEDNSDQITISPNPFSFQTSIAFAEEQKNAGIKITDMLGKEIRTIKFTGKTLVINKEEMRPGLYILQIKDEKNNVCNKRLIVD